MRKDLTKKDLYDSVKTLATIEDEYAHIHLCQHKLFNLFSIAFQYLLFRSTKRPGAYIIRIEDSMLAEKITKRAKDPSSRKFLQALLVPRKLKYAKSTFFLDFFQMNSWNMTQNIPKERIQGALIVKNTSRRPMALGIEDMEDPDEQSESLLNNLPENYFRQSLIEFVPKTITIAFESEFNDAEKIIFPFIKNEGEKAISGVKIAKNVKLDLLDDDQ